MHCDRQVRERRYYVFAHEKYMAARRSGGNDEAVHKLSANRDSRIEASVAEASAKDPAAALSELRAIEKDIGEICELMEQLRDMVERNGELVDQIEAWVSQDLEHVKVRARRRTIALVVSPRATISESGKLGRP
jgi:t-SNARE complex subunit (syntaxin)